MEFLEKALSVETLDKKPSVVFLPGHLFFVKALELPEGMQRSELNSFIEISLEEQAPFPLHQLFYGAYHLDDSNRVLVYAAYYKRFTPGEKDLWDDADLVVPDFVSVFGLAPTQASICVLRQEGSVTIVYFDGENPVPAKIASRGFDPETAPEDERRMIDELIAGFELGSRRPTVRFFRREGEVTRHGGSVHFPVVAIEADGRSASASSTEKSLLDRTVVSALDVREKAFLAEKRKAATRDAWLWRSVVGIAALILLLGIGEGLLYAAGSMLASREELVEARTERVARIQEQLDLAQRMEELGENRLLPFEMLAILNEHRPSSMHFLSARTDGWNGLIANVVTSNTRDVNEYENALLNSGNFETVDIRNQQVRDGQTTFLLETTFNRNALMAAAPVAQTSPAGPRRTMAVTNGENGREGVR